MLISHVNGILPVIVVMADESKNNKLDETQISQCREFKKILETTGKLSKSTHVLNENAGTACETTGILFEGLEHAEMHEDIFPALSDSDTTTSEIFTVIKKTIRENPQQIFIVCGTENGFKFMKKHFMDRN